MMPLAWDELFPVGCLPEKRLRLRAITIGQAMSERPGAAMTEAFDDWADTRTAYNFFENERMSLSVLLDPPTRALGRRLREMPEGTTVLNVQDTTEINLSHLSSMSGLGEIGNPKNRGLFAHVGLAVGTDGVPLGLLGTQTWARPVGELRKVRTKRATKALRDRSFEEKESVRWWSTIERAEEQVCRPGLLLHIGDRENDIYDVFVRSQRAGYRLLVRAGHDRKVEGEHGLLWAQAESFDESEERQVIDVPERPAKDGKPARVAREAKVAVRFGAVTLCAPRGATGSIAMWTVLVREVDPPDGVEPIEWLLLTLDPITSVADAWLRVEWYRYRWRIEEFFKVLKTGCLIEKRQFESRDTFEVSLGLSLLTAARLLALTKRARHDPDAPASEVLSPDEENILSLHAEAHRGRAPSPLRLAETVVLIAMLGGYKGRSCDGPPGWITLWRGYRRLCTMVHGYQLARTKPLKSVAPASKGHPEH